jgi:hypothetical protein
MVGRTEESASAARESVSYRSVHRVGGLAPSLAREARREDIRLLAASFLAEFGHATGRPAELMPDAMEALVNYEWPGNVRELRNVLERATIVCDDGRIRTADLSLSPAELMPVDTTDLTALRASGRRTSDTRRSLISARYSRAMHTLSPCHYACARIAFMSPVWNRRLGTLGADPSVQPRLVKTNSTSGGSVALKRSSAASATCRAGSFST